jgi:primase-polymerase (primpol)-like protein
VRVLTRGTFADPKQGRRRGDLEMYRGERYLTLTGCHLEGTPTTIERRQEAIDAIYNEFFRRPERPPTDPQTNGHSPCLDDSVLLERALNARNGGKLGRLLAGDLRGYPSPSEADLALCCLLAFWTQNAEQIDRLVRGSSLFREKWERPDYRDVTITKALTETVEHWTPSRQTHESVNGRGSITAGDDSEAENTKRESILLYNTDGKPVIRLTTNLSGMVNALQETILALSDGPRLFQRARPLCILGRGIKPPKWLRRPADALVILLILLAYLRELATAAAIFQKFDKRVQKWEDVLLPM